MTKHLAEYLGRSAARWPNRTAIVDVSGAQTTYEVLDRQADALGGFLASQGISRGDRVGIVLPKSTNAIVAFFGVMRAGAAYVPIDFSAPPDRSRRILVDCDVTALVTDGRWLKHIAGLSAQFKTTVVAGGGDDSATLPPGSTPWEVAVAHDCASRLTEARPDDLAYIIYTSGSTGTPKGAMISHENAAAFIEWCSTVLQPSENDRFSSHTPFHFDASVQDIYLALSHGASLHLIAEDVARNPKELAQFIEERRLTIWTSTPSALALLLQFGNLDRHPASSLRIVAFGGEVFPLKHLRELKMAWPSPTYFNMYGPTETTTTCTFARIPAVIPADRQAPYSIGFACSHCRTLILDEDHNEVAADSEGLLHVAGPSVFQGYWNRPTENAKAFIERDGVRWYNTGDVVRWSGTEGFIFVGRRDGMVKRRGFRIELGEIERTLYANAQIREAAVVAVPDAEIAVRIAAFVCCDEPRPSIIDLKTFCASKLPSYMIPDRFVFRDALPKTSTDKMDYETLKASL